MWNNNKRGRDVNVHHKGFSWRILSISCYYRERLRLTYESELAMTPLVLVTYVNADPHWLQSLVLDVVGMSWTSSSWLCCHLTALLDKPGPLRALFSSHPGPALFNCTLSNSGASQRATKDIYKILSILAKVQILSLQNIKKMSRKKMRRTNILHLWNEWVWEWLLDLYISTQSSGETEIGAEPDPAYVGAWLLPCWELESYT